MKKAAAVLGLLAAASFVLPGCYLSRQVAGDELAGGPTNPYLWVTVPIDTVLLPWEYSHFIDHNDAWNPWNAGRIRAEYVDQFKFPGE